MNIGEILISLSEEADSHVMIFLTRDNCVNN
jgi:hypothetical protein